MDIDVEKGSTGSMNYAPVWEPEKLKMRNGVSYPTKANLLKGRDAKLWV